MGHALIVSNNVTMPQAFVDIVFDPSIVDEYHMTYNISLDCEFILQSNTTHTAMIGFAYPNQWDDVWARSDFSEFDIWFDEEIMDYEIIPPSDVNNDTMLEEQADWLNYTSYAVITASFIAGANSTLRVSRQLVAHIFDGYFYFHYLAGTGAAWTGPTREEIRLTVTDTTYMKSYSFNPQEGLATEYSGRSVSAEWTIEEFTPDNALVGFSCSQDSSLLPAPDIAISITIASSIGGIMILAIVIQKRVTGAQ